MKRLGDSEERWRPGVQYSRKPKFAMAMARSPAREARALPGSGSQFQVTAVILLLSACSAFAQADANFSRANDEYARGQFQEAVHDYESLVQAHEWSAPLFYNLGNAYFRSGDLGRAILNYERALALEPQHPESLANLTVARDDARALE